MGKKKYTILTYNIGNYEKLREVENPSPICEYVYITDNKELRSDTWKIIYIENKHPEDKFELCYQIRFNPFKYAKTNIVIRIDGSIQPVGDTDKLYYRFIGGDYDIGLFAHPKRETLAQEYNTWIKERLYPKEQAERILTYLKDIEKYDVDNYKGLYQGGVVIHRRNRDNYNVCRFTYTILKYLAPKDKQIERLDQTIFSFVLNKYFTHLKVFPFDERIFDGVYFKHYMHNSNVETIVTPKDVPVYVFNKLTNVLGW